MNKMLGAISLAVIGIMIAFSIYGVAHSVPRIVSLMMEVDQ